MHKYITVAYDLFEVLPEGKSELLEQAPQEHPFQFITGLGMALDSFEAQVANLQEGDKFDFTLTPEEGYGPYMDDHVIEVPKTAFCQNGKFMADRVFPGNILTLVNADGNYFYGLVLEVGEETVQLDCNNLFAGKTLNYRGHVVTSREATEAEVTAAIQGYDAGGCGGCGGCGGDCNGGCGGNCGGGCK